MKKKKKKTDKAVRAEQLPTFRTIETLGGGAVACLLCHQKKNETKQKLSGNFLTMNQFLRFYEIFKILDFRKLNY